MPTSPRSPASSRETMFGAIAATIGGVRPGSYSLPGNRHRRNAPIGFASRPVIAMAFRPVVHGPAVRPRPPRFRVCRRSDSAEDRAGADRDCCGTYRTSAHYDGDADYDPDETADDRTRQTGRTLVYLWISGDPVAIDRDV